jgi:hypothetical protein
MSAFDVRVGKFGTLSVTAPYNTKFISEAKELGGRWSPTERTWNFTPSAAGELGRAMKKIFNFEHPLLAGPVQTKPLTVEEIDALYEELKVVADEGPEGVRGRRRRPDGGGRCRGGGGRCRGCGRRDRGGRGSRLPMRMSLSWLRKRLSRKRMLILSTQTRSGFWFRRRNSGGQKAPF